MADLRLARAELAKELRDRARLDPAAEEGVEVLGAGRDVDELGAAFVDDGCALKAERDDLCRCIALGSVDCEEGDLRAQDEPETATRPRRLHKRGDSRSPDTRPLPPLFHSEMKNAFDVLGKPPKKKRLGPSEFVAGEAEESDSDGREGFGRAHGDDDEDENIEGNVPNCFARCCEVANSQRRDGDHGE